MKIGECYEGQRVICVFACDICGKKDTEMNPLVYAEDGKTYCGDCAFIAGMISEQEYIKTFMYWNDLITRACVHDGKIYVLEGQKKYFPWEANANKRARNSSYYRNWQKKVFERDNYTCRICGKVGGDLNAHHIKPWKKYPEKRYEVENGLTLCVECHRNIHRKRKGV